MICDSSCNLNQINIRVIPLNEVMRLLRPVATMLAMWTNGPSFPSGIPAPNTHISPIAFEMGCMRSIDLYQET